MLLCFEAGGHGWTSPMRAGELEGGNVGIVRLLLSKGRSLRGTAVALLRCASRPPTSAQVSSGSRCCACAAPGAAAAPGPRGCHGDMPLAEASSPGHGHAACGAVLRAHNATAQAPSWLHVCCSLLFANPHTSAFVPTLLDCNVKSDPPQRPSAHKHTPQSRRGAASVCPVAPRFV